MPIYVMKLKGCEGLVEVGATSKSDVETALGSSQQYVEELELSEFPQDREITDYFNHVTDNPFAHLPFHQGELEGFISQLYHARHLCFQAEDEAEAMAWVKDYTERGALEVTYAKAFPERKGPEGNMYTVIIKVFPPEADKQVGYTPEAEEWLGVDPEFDEPVAQNVYSSHAMAAQRVAEKRLAMGL